MIVATGEAGVFVSGDELVFVAAAVRAQRRARRNNGLHESPRESDIFDAIEAAAEATRRGPDRQEAPSPSRTLAPVKNLTPAKAGPAEWCSTAQAARLLAITDRAVRGRIAAGHLRARRGVRGWLVDARSLDCATR